MQITRVTTKAVTRACIVVLAACTVHCGTGTASDGGSGIASTEEIGTAAQAILNGRLDTTHSSVMYIAAERGACTGTMIKVDVANKVGWVLTAAHCAGGDAGKPQYVYQGDDVAASPNTLRRYAVLDAVAHPNYNPNNFSRDLGMVRVYGVDAQTPVTPAIAAADGLAVGQSVVSVGYGRTTPADVNPPDKNQARRAITKQVANLSAMQIAYDQAPNQNPSGICSGDSGGPVLAQVGGKEQVVGVHSFVQNNCRLAGFSVRVNSEAAWLTARLADPIPSANTCSACRSIANSGGGACAAKLDACVAGGECRKLYDCVRACASASCAAACATQYPLGVGPYQAALGPTCACAASCGSLCKGDSACGGTLACGYNVLATACGNCQEQKCCAETASASADGVGYQCLESRGTNANCAQSAAYTGIGKCLQSKCATECKLTPVSTEPTPAEPTPAEPTPAAASSADPGSGCSIAAHPRSRSGASDASLAMLSLAAIWFARGQTKRRRKTNNNRAES